MKKKPVFLYVLLGISTLGVLSNIYGYIQLPNIINAMNELLKDETVVQQMGGEELIHFRIASFEWTRSLLALSMSVFTTILFGVSAFFLFFKKDVVRSTYAYLAMRLAVFLSWVVSVIMSNRMAHSILKDKEAIELALSGNKMTIVFYAVLTVLFSAIAYFGLRRYQKAVEDEALDAEVL